MTHLVPVALLAFLATVPAAAQTASASGDWRVRDTPPSINQRRMPAVDVGSYGRFGLGMYGVKPESARGPAVTVRDVTAPRHRRAGLGLSLKF